ncbi:MAG: Hpt domain-containing protein [Candidatus Delongbacteria bacterium]|nr:Hpt domain-containing protein [Candidatus Delongbacteria bacterium]
MNSQIALERLNNDLHLYRILIDAYLRSIPERMTQLGMSLQLGIMEDVRRHAHSIKSASAQIGAEQVYHLAGRIEKENAADELIKCRQYFGQLQIGFQILLTEIDRNFPGKR